MRRIPKINLIFGHLEVDMTRAIKELRSLLPFNLAFLALLLLSFLAAAYIIRVQLRAIAEQQALDNARLMMQTARASRMYTNKQIAPLLDHEQARVDQVIKSLHQAIDEHLPAVLEKALDRLPATKQAQQNVRQQILESIRQESRQLPEPEFFAQSIPFYAATEVFNYFRSEYPDYAYKEATLNPTNPRDRTVGWEADVVNVFRKTPSKTELFGRRQTPAGISLYYCAPIRVDSEDCLACHSTPDKAPPELVKVYGTANGFGWKFNDVVGAQIVSVPASSSERAADNALKQILWSLAIIFGVLFLLVNLIFYFYSRRWLAP
jgi:uncharacterized protein DUF3365